MQTEKKTKLSVQGTIKCKLFSKFILFILPIIRHFSSPRSSYIIGWKLYEPLLIIYLMYSLDIEMTDGKVNEE